MKQTSELASFKNSTNKIKVRHEFEKFNAHQ